MTEAGAPAEPLEDAIARVYAGPLDEFVQRRTEITKELRAAGRRDDANAVKALRKPSRAAWALDAAAVDAAGDMDRLVAAIAATIDAHGGGGDVRAAMDGLRQAVRTFAARAASISAAAGHRLDEPTLVNAVLAIIGRPDDFEALRRGRLVDVPAGGGLDFLSSLPAVAPRAVTATPPPASPPPEAAKKTSRRTAATREPAAPDLTQQDRVAEKKARETVQRARAAVANALAESSRAQRALEGVESRLQSAEDRLRAAEREAESLRAEREGVRQEVEAAASRLAEAEKTAANAERLLEKSRVSSPRN